MTCNSPCLWMRAFELNASLLIRKKKKVRRQWHLLALEREGIKPAHPDEGRALLSSFIWTVPWSCGPINLQNNLERGTWTYSCGQEQRAPWGAEAGGFCWSGLSLGRRRVLQGEGRSWPGAASLWALSENVLRDTSAPLTALAKYSSRTVLSWKTRKEKKMTECFVLFPWCDGRDPFSDISLGTLY